MCFPRQQRQDAEGWERDRFPSAVNRLGVGDGGSDLTLACSFHLQKRCLRKPLQETAEMRGTKSTGFLAPG